jgi:uroporphyrinogen decarboxylase
MNSRERVLTALRLEQPDRVPWIEGGVDAPLERALLGRDDYLPEDVADCLGLDNLIAPLLPPLFVDYEVHDGINYVAQPQIRTRADLDKVALPSTDDAAFYREAEEIVRRNQGRRAVAAKMRMGASPTLLSMGLDNFSYALADDPGLVDTVLGRFADWTIAIIGRLRDIGVDYVWTFDDMAYRAGPMFSPLVLRQVFMPHFRRVADAIHATGLPWILHSDGNLMPFMDDLLSLGMQGMHPFEPGPMDIEAMKAQIGHRVALAGNIDLHYTLTMGTPEEVDAEVKRRIEVVGKGGGYLISSANSITSYCKVENVLAMRDAIRKYGAYS